MNQSLLAARISKPLADLKAKGRATRAAIGVRSYTEWDGPEQTQVGADRVRVVWCRSLLDMREHICAERDVPLVIVTSIEQNQLPDDLLARLFKNRLLKIDVWEILRERFAAKSVDPRLLRDAALGDAIIEYLGADRTPAPVASGLLHEDAAWEFLLRESVGINSARPEPADLLAWATNAANVQQYMSLNAPLRTRIAERLRQTGGPLAAAFLDSMESGETFAVGLALECFTTPTPNRTGSLDQMRALGSMSRFTANQPMTVEIARSWFHAADAFAARLIQQGQPLVVRQAAEGADRLLESALASGFAKLSRWSPQGGRQLLDDIGGSMLRMPNETSSLEAAIERLKERHWFESDRPVLERVAMAVRLLRWLATPVREPRQFTEAAEAYASDGSWVDWARYKIRAGYSSGPFAAALQKIGAEVQLRREVENRRFARLLAEWTADGSPSSRIIGVEKVLEKYAGGIDTNNHPILVIVMDGMSCAVARELERDFPTTRWIPRAPDRRELPPAVAALPSVTQYSRYSLLAGRIGAGTQNIEAREFAANAAFGGAEAVLFHKSDLASLGDLSSSPVISEIANRSRRVVGVVINAIDDQLGGSDQLNQEWSLEYMPVLRILLAEAATAGRVVILTSDHGHTLDFGTELRRNEGSDRYRTGAPEFEDELLVSGSRVVPGSATALAVERFRYGARPRSGYHGGLTPQECLVPVYVLATASMQLPNWSEVPATQPSWWEPTAEAPAVPAAPPKPSKRKAQPTLFPTEPDWVDRLHASDTFKDQMELAGKRIRRETMIEALRALESAGGRLLKPAFAQRMNIPLLRVSTTVAALQAVLNFDGYQVLNLDEASQTVTLDRNLLETQFEL